METFFEYVVKPPQGYKKIKKRKISLIIFYCAFCVIAVGGVLMTPILNRYIVPIALVAAIVCFAIYRLTWPKTKPEYEYCIEIDTLKLAVIYGGRIRRIIVRTGVKEAELIAPNNGMYQNKIKDFAPEKEYSGAFTDGQKNYFMLFRNENDVKSILYFSADAEQIKHFRRLNGRTVVDRTAKTNEND